LTSHQNGSRTSSKFAEKVNPAAFYQVDNEDESDSHEELVKRKEHGLNWRESKMK
jgi:hypothetical protein